MTLPQRWQLKADIDFLDRHDAMEGIGAIVRARREKIEHGYDAAHDDQYGTARLTVLAILGLHADDIQEGLERAGALLAAEMDLLGRAAS